MATALQCNGMLIYFCTYKSSIGHYVSLNALLLQGSTERLTLFGEQFISSYMLKRESLATNYEGVIFNKNEKWEYSIIENGSK
jgi:hypothetical protein